MVILSSDTVLVYPVTGGLGGPISNIRIPNNILSNVWPDISMTDLEAGKTWYFLVYLYNDNKTSETLDNVRLFVYQSTVSSYTDIAIALGQAPINSSESEIANKESPPPGITNWTKGQSEDDSLFIGRLPPRSFKSIWLRLTVNVAPSGSSFPFDNYVLLSRHNPVAGPIMLPGPGLPGEEPVPSPPGSPPPPPPPPAAIVNDPFGIRMIYQTSQAQNASAPFLLPSTNPHLSARFDAGGIISDNGDGSWRSNDRSPQIKMYSAGEGGVVKQQAQSFANAADTYDHSDIAARGYWWKPNDWRAVEATGYFFLRETVAALGSRGLQFMFRKLTHSASVASGCGASYYGVYIRDDGRPTFNKAHYNIDPDPQPCNDNQFLPTFANAFNSPRLAVNTGSLRQKWFGFKAVIWNFVFDGVPAGWTWYNPTSFDMADGNPYPPAGNTVYQEWQIRYELNAQYWYITHKDEAKGEEVNWHGEFWNYANAVKYLDYLRDNILPSGPGVHLELWLDVNRTNTWVRQGVFDDGGYWLVGANDNLTSCPGGERCGGAHDQIITWAGPYVELQPDNYTENTVNWTSLSVREIIQPWTTYQYTSVGVTSTSPPAPPPSPPSPPPPAATLDTFGIAKLNATISGGKEWYSTAWSTGSSRDYNPSGANYEGYDSLDGNFYMVLIGDSKATILGNGEIEVDGGSPRLYPQGPWTNTEYTFYVKIQVAQPSGMYVHIGSRSNHEIKDSEGDRCGFGRYVVKYDHGRSSGPKMACDKEVMHPIHTTTEFNAQSFPGFSTTTWLGCKMLCRTTADGNSVKVEGYIDTTGGANGGIWQKITEWTDDGTADVQITGNESYITDCTTSSDPDCPLLVNGVGPASNNNLKQVWKKAAKHCGVRIQNCDQVRFKWMSVREIPSLAGGGGTPPSPPPPPSTPVDDFGIKWIYARPSTGGTMWHSVNWNNGINRNVPGDCGVDPHDSALHHTDNDGSVCNINGAGVMRVSQSGRISIHRTVRNCEATVYLKYPTAMQGNVHFQPKTEHYCLGGNDLFGGYILYIDEANQAIYWKKEQSHNIGYTSRLGEVSISWAANTWMGFKAICYNSGNNVILEAWIDTTGGANGGTWQKKITLTDTGNWSIGGQTYPPMRDECRQGAIRIDHQGSNSYFDCRWMSFREISPPT